MSRFRGKVRRRAKRVHAAAAEAAQDDPPFAAETVLAEGRRLFMAAQHAWHDRDREALRRIVGPELMVEWERRLDKFERKGWRNWVTVDRDSVEVHYVGLVNRERDEEDRAVVYISATIDSYVIDRHGNTILKEGEQEKTVLLSEYWTLAKRDGRWTVASIEQEGEGEHHLQGRIVATPWSDDERLSDEAVTELAVADGLPDGFKLADLADLDFDGDARAAALDLALADPRFSPQVLEAAARRAVEAWAAAVDGEDAPLEAVATPEAISELLYGADHGRTTRLVVRGPRVKHIQIADLDAGRDPATMTITVELGGRRYTEDRDTAAVLSGSKERTATFTERWTLALDGPGDSPWRIVDARACAHRP
jgi:predicted lipid-binding transport protein (Tim44 family)